MEILFYIVNTVLVFTSALTIIALAELIDFLIIKRKKYVDNRKGKIVKFYLNDESFQSLTDSRLESTTTVGNYVVECYVDGKKYVQNAKRLTKKFYFTKKNLANKLNEEIEIKYDYSSKGNIRFYIYEKKDTIKQICTRFIIGFASILMIILLWTLL